MTQERINELIATCERMNVQETYAVKRIGEEPAKYGYVKIEGEPEESNDGGSISIACDTKEDLEWVYTRMCVTLLDHPSVLDLRGLNVRII